MYRYSIGNIITYSSEDIILFKDSPFASWMERLTLENPDHGIAPDAESEFLLFGQEQQSAGAERFAIQGSNIELIGWEDVISIKKPLSAPRAGHNKQLVEAQVVDGKDVVVIDPLKDEHLRRSETNQAMRDGADLIVNGQLASGPLSDTVDLLMRSSGVSDFGNYLYIPCDTRTKTTPHSAFRLCFAADLLDVLQGVLPPQMFLIRSDTDMVSLVTEDHIYYHRAVKQRFMKAQREFRKHRMPNPAASSHFGRWSKCAIDLLKQRALADDPSPDTTAPEEAHDDSSWVTPGVNTTLDDHGLNLEGAPAPSLRPLKINASYGAEEHGVSESRDFSGSAALLHKTVQSPMPAYREASAPHSRVQIPSGNSRALMGKKSEALSPRSPLIDRDESLVLVKEGLLTRAHEPQFATTANKEFSQPPSSVLITCVDNDD